MAKDSEHSQPGEPAGYTYGNSGYSGYSAAGYGYGDAGGGGGPQRTFQDYILILRERIWYIVVVFLVVFSSALVYTLNQTKVYQSSARIQILRQDPTVMQMKQVSDTDIRSAEDFQTQIKVMESKAIALRVAEKVKGDDLRALLAPYGMTTADPETVAGVLLAGRLILPQRATLMVDVAFRHPDPVVTAKMANLFVQEYLEHNSQLRYDATVWAVEQLERSIVEQQKKVQGLSLELQEYKEKNNMVSLDERKNVVLDALKAANSDRTTWAQNLASAEIRRKQIQEYREKKANLTELPFIASQANIAALLQQQVEHNITIKTLAGRYKALHPEMITARDKAAETDRELERVIEAACASVEAEYQGILRNYNQAEKKYAEAEKESLELDRMALAYNNKASELLTQQEFLRTITGRNTETAMSSNIPTQNARPLDKAVPPGENYPISPNLPLNLGLGIVGGLGLGLAFAFFVAFIDDRVKSSFDIEGVVGLPLIGVIPQIKRMDPAEKAQIVANNADRQVAEAFLTLHSSLRLKDESKNAKCILTTSTIPGEGKSFTTTNLALTFAAHGERVLIVDCDLRKPNVHKSFRIENLKGVIDICSGKSAIEDVVVRNLHPNLDVLPAGGRAKNPTHILNSKAFEVMVSDLRKTYDRIFIDTPPLAAVSDALIILPLVDGSIFTIYFNKVRRKAAQFAAKRLLDSNVPNFGAVLNGLNIAVSGYYYAQYYDKSYSDYYVVSAKDGDSRER